MDLTIDNGAQLMKAVREHHPDLYEAAKNMWMVGKVATRVDAMAKLSGFRERDDTEDWSAYLDALWLWI